MTETFAPNEELARFYQTLRTIITDVLDVENPLTSDALVSEIDHRVEIQVGKIVVLEDEDEVGTTSYTPQTSSQSMLDGIFNMVVSCILHDSQMLGPEAARERMRGYLEQLMAGLESDETATMEGNT